jgi:hypothetical protein
MVASMLVMSSSTLGLHRHRLCVHFTDLAAALVHLVSLNDTTICDLDLSHRPYAASPSSTTPSFSPWPDPAPPRRTVSLPLSPSVSLSM